MAERPSTASCFGAVNVLQEEAYAYGQVYMCKTKTSELRLQAHILTDSTVTEKLSKICHPNIVHYLGVAHDEATSRPILLTELMGDSLTHFLELSEARLPCHVQVNINYDIAQALAFLHTNRILHRDLSSNNVLLIGAGVRAKIILCMSDTNSSYMPPEALLDPPIYTEKLNCFQAGVLMVQIITRKSPDPGPAMTKVKYPTGWDNALVPELTRRDNHLRLVTTTHPMYSLAVNCLKDIYTERPSAHEICHHLSALKKTPQYRQSLEAGEGGERDGDIQERDQRIQQLRQENEERGGENQSLRDEQKEEERQRQSRRLDLTNVQIQQALETRCHQVENLQKEKEDLLREKEQLRKENEQLRNEKDALIWKFKEEKDLLQKKYKEGQQRKRGADDYGQITRKIAELEQELKKKDSLLNKLSPMKQIAQQYHGEYDKLTFEYEELWTNPDIIDQLKEHFDEINARRFLTDLIMKAYDASKTHMFSILIKKMEELHQVQGGATKLLEDRSRGFGLLLHSSGLRLQQTAPTEVTEEIKKSKIQELLQIHQAKGKLEIDKLPLDKIAAITWKFVTQPSPIIVCQPDKYNSAIHDECPGYWDEDQKDSKLIYIQPVVYRSYHGEIIRRGLVANKLKKL